MPEPAAALALALLLGAAGRADGASALVRAADAAGEAAMEFVSEFSDDHLSGMLSRIGGQSEAMRTLSRIDARMLAAAFDAEIDAAVDRHGAAWAGNLALAWDPLLTDAEMRSLVAEGAASPHAGKYAAVRDEAAAAMATRSQDLFRAILVEVVGNTLRALGAEPSADE